MRRFSADSFPQLYLVNSRERSTRQYRGVRAVEQVHFWEADLLNTVKLPAQHSAMPFHLLVLLPVKGRDALCHPCSWWSLLGGDTRMWSRCPSM